MSNSRIVITALARERLEEELLALRKRVINEIVTSKSLPGEDEIEISENDIAETFREIRQQLQRVRSRRRDVTSLLSFVYVLIGGAIMVGTVSLEYIESALRLHPERTMLFLTGLATAVVGILGRMWFARRQSSSASSTGGTAWDSSGAVEWQSLKALTKFEQDDDSTGSTVQDRRVTEALLTYYLTNVLQKGTRVDGEKREIEELRGDGLVEMPDGRRVPVTYDVHRYKHYQIVHTNSGEQELDTGVESFTCRLSHGGRLHPDLSSTASMFLILEDGRRLELLHKRSNLREGITEVIVTGGLLGTQSLND